MNSRNTQRLTGRRVEEIGFVSRQLLIRQITSSQPLMLLIAVVVYVLQTRTVSLCLAADQLNIQISQGSAATDLR